MIINIGARNTELAVIADKRVIINRMIPAGGDRFNEAIMEGILRRKQFLVSFRTAQKLKLSCVRLAEVLQEGRRISGIDVQKSLPGTCVVQTGMINSFVRSELTAICDEIRTFLDRIPPQVRQCIMNEGIYLTGGTSQIPGIGFIMQDLMGCSVHVSKQYDLCTISGLKEIITHSELQHWAFAPRPH